MAGKRKAKPQDPMRPSKWRLQHAGLAEPIREADPETGTPVQHHRMVDSLGQMLANGTITPAMHEAGALFRTQFRAAALDGMRTMQMVRIAASTGTAVSERQLDARGRVARAISALGGWDSAAGSCMWHVVGLECSIREWAMRHGWSGRVVNPAQAQGMVVAALGVLAAHYGTAPRARAA